MNKIDDHYTRDYKVQTMTDLPIDGLCKMLELVKKIKYYLFINFSSRL